MPIDVKQLADTIKGWVAERLNEFEASLPDRLRKHIDELPKPQNGKDADPQVMEAEIARQVALLPKPADGKSVSEDAVALIVKAEVAKLPPAQKGADADPRLVETLVNAKVAEAMAKIRQPADGKSVEAAEVRGMVSTEVAAQVAQLPKPAAGKDADPADIERAAKAAVAALPAPDVATLVRAEVQRQIGELPKPKNGEDGKSVDPEVVRAMIAAIVREAVAAIPAPQNGKDADQPAIVAQVFDLVMRAMPKPQDGKSVTVEDVKPLLEAEVQHWELEFERRVSDRLERLAERYKGKDGEDGFSPEDLELELMDDGRTVAVSLKAASGRVVRKELVLVGMTQDRDVFRAGAAYKKGDCVTYGGSYWCAKSDTSEPPRGPSNAWRMVMKGRDK